MKILVTYLSMTGNTEKLANAICEEASGSNDADLKKIDDVSADGLGDYDVVFVGSPIHAGGLAGPAKGFLDGLSDGAGFKLAGFTTHSSDAYSKENFEKGLAMFEKIAGNKGITYLGCFDCQGKLADAIRPMVQQAGKISDEEFAKVMEETDKHPDVEDLQNAKNFAKEVLSKA